MIEKMKVLHIVASASKKEELLSQLRDLGVVHFTEKQNADKTCLDRLNNLSKAVLTLKDYAPKTFSSDILDDEKFESLFEKVLEAIELKKELVSKRGNAVASRDRLVAWGDFIPAEVKALKEEGFNLHFYKLDKKTLDVLAVDQNVKYVNLAPVDKTPAIAVLGELNAEFASNEFTLPEKGLGELDAEIESCDAKLKECEDILINAAFEIPSFNNQILKAQNVEEYSSMSNTTRCEDSLVWLSGYIPESDVDGFKDLASKEGFAYAICDPDEDDEKVPTKVKYTKLTKLMTPVFDILGIVPGYKEYDISFWFLGFFTLFFAMIIGDAGYGLIFLLVSIALHVKGKKLTDTVMLLYVLSIGTIIWGGLTGTWFGLEGAMKIPLLKGLVIPSFANYPEYFGVSTTDQQNAIMKFCFIIGTVQLTLACIMNIRRKLKEKNLSLMADVGWLLAIDALYFVVLFLVIGEKVNLTPVAVIVIIGFFMVVVFGGMAPGKSFAEGLKAGLGDAFTCFLNTISAFGNIMSYIRLFAVGMASLAIAQSFNNMALGFDGPLVVVGAVIMIIGHALNLVMGLLSVVVHGVRLNLLEFSGQLGMEWSGIAYNPFKKLDKIKK